MELFWVSLFRVRYYILLEKGYDPVLWNFDETPYYQNETGAQNKAVLAVQGTNVPLVESKPAAHARWTASLSCCSSEKRIEQRWPFVEAMYKFKDDGPKHKELQEIHRANRIPSWLSVTTAPKGTYRECDIVALLERHLPAWNDDDRQIESPQNRQRQRSDVEP